MLFQNLTRAAEIGANCYLLSLGNSNILLDAGLHPRQTGLDALPALDSLPFDSIDAVILSHAHLDHAGSLPVVLRHHPSASVYMTEPTRDLADAMLHNSVNVMNYQRDELGISSYPLFTHKEINSFFPASQTRLTRRPFPVGKDEDAIECEFFDAGHILGAVGILLRYRGETIFYTGDVHFEDQSLVKAARFPEETLDVLIVESTRGAEARAPDYTRASEIERFGHTIRTTLDRGGSVLIPVFAVGKTQETLTVLDQLKKNDAFHDADVYLGGLSTKMTTVYDNHAGNSHRHHPNFRILDHMDLVLSGPRHHKRRRPIPYSPRSIYALSSGMMTENTLSNRFARNILPNPKNALLFVGYADPASPAGKILDAKPGDHLQLSPAEKSLPLRCSVEKYDFSGHATRESIRDFVVNAKPRKALLVHGDTEATRWFNRAITESLPHCDVSVPAPGLRVHLHPA